MKAWLSTNQTLTTYRRGFGQETLIANRPARGIGRCDQIHELAARLYLATLTMCSVKEGRREKGEEGEGAEGEGEEGEEGEAGGKEGRRAKGSGRRMKNPQTPQR